MIDRLAEFADELNELEATLPDLYAAGDQNADWLEAERQLKAGL